MNEGDRQLIQLCREGEHEAFGQIVEKYQKVVFNVVYRMVRDFEETRDITQSVFLKAFRGLDTYDGKQRFFSWLYRIAVNESLNSLKSRKITVSIDERFPSSTLSPEKVLETSERERVMHKGLMQLTPDYRAVLVLRHIAGCSYRELSEVLEIPEKTVKSRLFTARQLLRERLKVLRRKQNA